MKITSRDSIGLTIRFSWRELGFLRSLMPIAKNVSCRKDEREFCAAFIGKLRIEIDKKEESK